MTSLAPPPSDDPKPKPPEPPDINDCCGNGCDPCIFDRHDMAMDEYRQALSEYSPQSPQVF